MVKRSNIASLLGILMMLIFFVISFSIGYLITNSIFKIADKPLNYGYFLLTFFMGYLVVIIAILFFGGFMKYTEVGRKHNDEHNRILINTMDAIDKISHGNFNVFIDIDREDYYNDVAQSVNKMAKELSSMETLKQDFISNVSHEIQSPLTSISGFAALLKSDDLSKHDRYHYLEIIETESKRLSKLSDNLLKLSTLEVNNDKLEKIEFRLDLQIKNVVLMLEPQWQEKGLSINLDIEEVIINLDEDLIFQVWSNLIHNAIKFTPLKGTIDISLKTENNDIIFIIKDNGIGITKKDQMHVFERFYKADKSRDRSLGGNGLGLALVKKIIELNYGSIQVVSELNQGTTFMIRLPK